MDLDNQAAESGLDTGNAGGDTRIDSTPVTQAASPEKLSLKDSLAKAAAGIRERTDTPSPARESTPAPKTAFEPKGTNPSSPPVQAGQPGEPASSILEAPKHWPQQRREAFAKHASTNPELARDWLEHTKQLEGEFTRKAQEQAEARKFGESVRELFTPEHRSVMQASGINETAAIKWLLDVDGYARKDPAGYAKWFMQQVGLTPQQLFPELGQGSQATQAAQPEQQEWIDPEFTKLREEIGPLKSELQALRQWKQQQDQERQAQGQQAIDRTIQEFASSTDAEGNPLYPHFAELEEEMAFQINRPDLQHLPLGADKLKRAYDLALRANDTLWQAEMDKRAAAEQAEAAKRQAAERARAATTIKPKVGSVAGATAAKPNDLKSLIRDAAGRARG